MKYIIASILLVCLFAGLEADTPANCTYEDIRGLWVFHEGPRGNPKSINCSEKFTPTNVFFVRLDFPNLATDFDGNVGFWTIIYNQGFEVVINNRKYFAFSLYTQKGQNVTSYCHSTFGGWSHETGVNPGDWSCYTGSKADADEQNTGVKTYQLKKDNVILESMIESKRYKTDLDFIERIHMVQSSWKAQHYDFLNELTVGDLIKMAGGKKSRIINKPRAIKASEDIELIASQLPSSFDWRDVSGTNYVSPIRNQASCGSCYAFAAMGINEARLRIKTNNKQQTIFSTQDIVECSQYSQGCDGGFPYLVSGKYGEDFGLVEESCNPYKGMDGKCHTNATCKRSYTTKYHYVGGFYGACNEAMMKIELVKNGPLVVSFEVYSDFFNYAGGVYHHTSQRDHSNFGKFEPFEITNHAVLLVGYGTDDATKQDYWIVKNSWGTGWGEHGYFRIRRGTDECAIESIAVGADIIV